MIVNDDNGDFFVKLLTKYRKSGVVVRALDSQSRVLSSKPLDDSKVDAAFNDSKVDQMSTRNFVVLSSKK